jgi:hypothetical protein
MVKGFYLVFHENKNWPNASTHCLPCLALPCAGRVYIGNSDFQTVQTSSPTLDNQSIIVHFQQAAA